jgi:hypothetical protein
VGSEGVDGGRLRHRRAPLFTVRAYSEGSITLIESVDEHKYAGDDNNDEDTAHLQYLCERDTGANMVVNSNRPSIIFAGPFYQYRYRWRTDSNFRFILTQKYA